MSTTDKTKNKAQEVTGKAKAKAGEITGDKNLRAHGKAERSGANVKQAREKVKGALKH